MLLIPVRPADVSSRGIKTKEQLANLRIMLMKEASVQSAVIINLVLAVSSVPFDTDVRNDKLSK